MKSRIKVPLTPSISSRDDAEAAMNDLAMTINNQRRITTERDARVLVVNQSYEAPLAECDQSIKALSGALQAWAECNPDQFPKGRKSLELVSGVLGFRTGTPKLALLSRAFNWDKCIGLLRSHLPGFIRTKEEPDKEGLLTARSQNQITDLDLCKVGLKVTQDESFYIDPKLTDMNVRQTQEAA